jgi:hypothetical protein
MHKKLDTTFRFISENFMLFDDIHDLDIPKKNDEWITLLLCEQGRCDTELNGKHILIHKNDLLFCTPQTIMDHSMMSPDFKGRIIGISGRLNKEIFPNSAKIWRQAFEMRQQGSISLPKEFIEDLEIDWDYIKCRIVEQSNNYYMDTMRCLIQALMYRISDKLDILLGSTDIPDHLHSKEYLSRQFFDLLASTSPKQRSVTWYADRLCKTPKYLSTVVKQTSGRTASEWIHETVAAEIADRLKNSPKSIKEICDELDFPNLSFFGRYVREHLGVSPTEYRRQKRSASANR